ncbi:putative phosphoglycerate mutase family protein [Amanita rubescens]|nr:putative phosphoglycerate mutase family protein [Amanita rubescens]
MGWFNDDSDQCNAHNQWNGDFDPQPHKAELSHELIAGAAAFEATKAYERHCAENGKPASHALAKELMAGFAGAFVDREVETKGLDFIDRERAKREAKKHLNDFGEQDYGY